MDGRPRLEEIQEGHHGLCGVKGISDIRMHPDRKSQEAQSSLALPPPLPELHPVCRIAHRRTHHLEGLVKDGRGRKVSGD